MGFWGYRRADGGVGVRNYVAVIPTTVCANDVVVAIAGQVDGAVAIPHTEGCCQLAPDLEQITRVLIGLGRNPNVAGVVVVSLGCESIAAGPVAEGIAQSGRSVERIGIQDVGGSTKAIAQGVRLAQKLVEETRSEREFFDNNLLMLGLKCGASDATSGLASNPATGEAVDLVLAGGGTVIFGEVTEMMGAEHVLTSRAANEEVASGIIRLVTRMEERAKSMGVDMRGGQPTAGNIEGGLTTIEEKSLGAIVKAGTGQIRGLLKYGERPAGPGLYAMEMPGREPEALTGLAAGGAQVVVFSTGLGAPQGFPIVPVIKVTGNARTARHLQEHIDIDVSGILEGTEAIADAGQRIHGEILEVVNGKETRAESLRYHGTVGIYTTGPIV